MMQLSIIVPAYNVELWLLRCLNSLYAQNLQNDEYEVIVVNDGSTDNSLQIAEEFASSHVNMRVITRKNGGLSAARNTGMEYAQGEFVWFVDSDDWIENNVLRDIVRLCSHNKLDVLSFGLRLYYEDHTVTKYPIRDKSDGKLLNGQEFVLNVNMPPAAWCSIFRREYLINNNLRFYEGILHEDQEFTPRAYILCERVLFYDCVVYNYFQRTGSIMKSSNYERKADSLLIAADSLYCFSQSYIFEKQASRWLMNRVYFTFCQSLTYATKLNRSLDTYKEKPYYPLKLSYSSNRIEMLKYLIINVSPLLFKWIYRLQ